MKDKLKITNPDDFWFSSSHPVDGRAVRFHFDEFMVEWISTVYDGIRDEGIFTEVYKYIKPELIEIYIKQALYVDLVGTIRELYRRQFVSNHYGCTTHKKIVSTSAKVELISRYWDGDETKHLKVIYFYTTYKKLVGVIENLKKKLYKLFYVKEDKVTSNNSDRSTIVVELVEGIDTNNKCDAFWLNAGIINPERVIFLLEKSNYGFVDVEKEKTTADRINSKIVTIDTGAHQLPGVEFWYDNKQPEWGILLCQKIRKSNLGQFWLKQTLLDLLTKVSFWENFYRYYNVAVYQHFTELSVSSIIRRIACDRVGAIQVGKQRSQFFFKASAAFYFNHEVAFCWHRKIKDVLLYGKTCPSVLLETGYVYDYIQSVCTDDVAAIHERFEQKGVTVIISAYDNYPHRNGHFSNEQLREFYLCLYKILHNYSSVGIIVKSKKHHITNFSFVKNVINDMVETGRCLVFDEPFTSVIPSAKASNIAVGIPASTAVTEAATTGCFTVMYDPSRCEIVPLQNHNCSDIGYTIEEFEKKLENRINSSSGERCHEYPLDVSPYDDNNAPFRAAKFLNDYIELKDGGLSKNEALNGAIGRNRSVVVSSN